MNDTGEAQRARARGSGVERKDADPNRRPPDAASVSSRWWEVGVPMPSARGASLQPPPPPPPRPAAAIATNANAAAVKAPPPPPLPSRLGSESRLREPGQRPLGAAGDKARSERLEIQRLEQELAAARDEAAALHDMLEDLPEIFERKFRQRLQVILEQQQLLLADNRQLREQLYALQPAPGEPERRPSRLLLPAFAPAEATPDRPKPLRRVLHGIRRLGNRLRPGGSGSQAGNDGLSDRVDGPPTAA